ncbi:SCO1431 family membrane protein [Streptomyces sp. NPDC050418]|uniref:SCO1431 family membrane protein n=1 Tax=Streptomyces sp. NPDC050418 TaxID=3365612 RepID=UPI00379E267F
MSESAMNSSARAATSTAEVAEYVRSRTGGPKDDGPKILEHLAGWTLVVVVAMLVTQLGLL